MWPMNKRYKGLLSYWNGANYVYYNISRYRYPEPGGSQVYCALGESVHCHPRSLHDSTGRGINTEEAVCPSRQDRKSTRLNSSHLVISYAVFCLKKKKLKENKYIMRKEKIKKTNN